MNASRNRKTSIWRQTDGTTIRVAEMDGFPWGKARIGEKTLLGDYGWARCTGVATTGSGASEQIKEIAFTLI